MACVVRSSPSMSLMPLVHGGGCVHSYLLWTVVNTIIKTRRARGRCGGERAAR
ncbi:hypothetical protein T492DRAFT_898777, partial [Pavlovales sp. CCMP2436]